MRNEQALNLKGGLFNTVVLVLRPQHLGDGTSAETSKRQTAVASAGHSLSRTMSLWDEAEVKRHIRRGSR